MWCDPPSVPAPAVTQSWSSLRNFPYALPPPVPADSTATKLSFVYQPGVGLYDKKKSNLDQDLRVTNTGDVDERVRIEKVDDFTSDVDHRWSPESIKAENLYKACLRRQNEQDSLPVRPKSLPTTKKFLTNDSDIPKKSLPNTPTTTHFHQHHHVHHVQLFNINNSQINLTSSLPIDLLKQITPIKPNDNNSKRKLDAESDIFNPSPCYEKRRRPPPAPQPSIPKVNLFPSTPNRGQVTPVKQEIVETTSPSNKCEKNLLDEELNRQKAKLLLIEEQQRKTKLPVVIKKKISLKKTTSLPEQITPIKIRPTTTEEIAPPVAKPKVIADVPVVKKAQPEIVPSQGLLLCPKVEPMVEKKKKKKKKIATTVAENTSSLDDDLVLDSILFDDMQANHQQWQQWMVLTMEKELHLDSNLSELKKKNNCKLSTTCSTSSDLPPLPLGPQPATNRFVRSSEFLAAYEKLFAFDGMRHWHSTTQ